ncbi:MAG TPA: hypothetical protein DC049_14965 [Spirochaetia bacterium]|nr:hypothetical protein [Spirochaetia bacterium]
MKRITLRNIVLLTGLILTGCSKKSSDVTAFIQNSSRPSGETIASVNKKYFINKSDFINEYNLQIDQLELADDKARELRNDNENQEKYLDEVIMQYIVFDKACKEKITEEPVFLTYLQLVMRDTVYQYYLKKKIFTGIKVSEHEVAEYYSKNKEKYTKNFGSREEAEIMQIIKNQKFKDAYFEYLGSLKEKAVVERKRINE